MSDPTWATRSSRWVAPVLGSLGVQKYAADVDTLQRVVAHGVQADGTAPVTIEGDLINFVDSTATP